MLRLAVLLVLVSGCVHTQPATLTTPGGRADLNARTAGRVATLHLRDGPRQSARDVHVGPDETTWIDRLSGAPRSAPTADVVSVSLNRGRAWRGALIGAGIGAAFGVVGALADDCRGFVCFPPAAIIGISTLDGGVIGAAAGALQTERFVPTAPLGVRLDSLGQP